MQWMSNHSSSVYYCLLLPNNAHTIYHQFTIALVICFRFSFSFSIHSLSPLICCHTIKCGVLQMWQSKCEKKSKFNEVQIKLEQRVSRENFAQGESENCAGHTQTIVDRITKRWNDLRNTVDKWKIIAAWGLSIANWMLIHQPSFLEKRE